MDDDFAFSFHRTREEWEQEQREFEEFNRKFEQQRRRDETFIDGQTQPHEFLGVDQQQARVWQSSFSNPQAADDMPLTEALPMMLFGIGAHLAELSQDLKADDRRPHTPPSPQAPLPEGEGGGVRGRSEASPINDAERARSLRSHFTEVRRAIDDRNPWTAESAVARFSEELNDLATLHPHLSPKCTDLARQLDHLLHRCREDPDFDRELPF